mgnify:CR=1 FL=1
MNQLLLFDLIILHKIEFFKFIRQEKQFESAKQLASTVQRDCREVKEFFKHDFKF